MDLVAYVDEHGRGVLGPKEVKAYSVAIQALHKLGNNIYARVQRGLAVGLAQRLAPIYVRQATNGASTPKDDERELRELLLECGAPTDEAAVAALSVDPENISKLASNPENKRAVTARWIAKANAAKVFGVTVKSLHTWEGEDALEKFIALVENKHGAKRRLLRRLLPIIGFNPHEVEAIDDAIDRIPRWRTPASVDRR